MLIGLAGCKDSGKDTAASFLVEKGYIRMAFADQLKRAVAALFDIKVEEVDELKDLESLGYAAHVKIATAGMQLTMTWREFLQRFGTEMCREVFGTDFWVDQWESQFATLAKTAALATLHDVVVSDVRFNNEAERISHLGGFVVQIKRPGHEPDGHASEEPIDQHWIDGTIHNDGSLQLLKKRVFDLEDYFRNG